MAIIALSVVAIAVGLLATGIAARALRPVRTLIDGVSRIGRGDYSAKLGIRGDDEIAVLAREFDAMARSLKEREAQLAEKQAELLGAERLAAVGRVSAQVAHEVRNPLSSIGLNVEMLSDQIATAHFDDPESAREARELLDAVTNEVDRITAITDEYLTLARLPSPTLRRENLVARSAAQGAVLGKRLHTEFDGHPAVADVRGRGMFYGLELRCSRDAVVMAALQRDLWIYPAGSGPVPDAVMVAPPFVVSDAEIEQIVTTLRVALDSVFTG